MYFSLLQHMKPRHCIMCRPGVYLNNNKVCLTYTNHIYGSNNSDWYKPGLRKPDLYT